MTPSRRAPLPASSGPHPLFWPVRADRVAATPDEQRRVQAIRSVSLSSVAVDQQVNRLVQEGPTEPVLAAALARSTNPPGRGAGNRVIDRWAAQLAGCVGPTEWTSAQDTFWATSKQPLPGAMKVARARLQRACRRAPDLPAYLALALQAPHAGWLQVLARHAPDWDLATLESVFHFLHSDPDRYGASRRWEHDLLRSLLPNRQLPVTFWRQISDTLTPPLLQGRDAAGNSLCQVGSIPCHLVSHLVRTAWEREAPSPAVRAVLVAWIRRLHRVPHPAQPTFESAPPVLWWQHQLLRDAFQSRVVSWAEIAPSPPAGVVPRLEVEAELWLHHPDLPLEVVRATLQAFPRHPLRALVAAHPLWMADPDIRTILWRHAKGSVTTLLPFLSHGTPEETQAALERLVVLSPRALLAALHVSPAALPAGVHLPPAALQHLLQHRDQRVRTELLTLLHQVPTLHDVETAAVPAHLPSRIRRPPQPPRR